MQDKFIFIFKIVIILVISYLISLLYNELKENFQPESRDKKMSMIRSSLEKIEPEKIRELSFFEDDKCAFTINKKNIHIKLKDKKGNYYDDNMLIYVALHELAHSICDEVGHTKKFHEIFERLLDKAAEKGIFDPSKQLLEKYCEKSN